jgi:hypothetical protein
MKFKVISYSKTFPIAQYINEKIGVEIELDDTDNPEEVFKRAKQTVEIFYRQSNPESFLEARERITDNGHAKYPLTPSESQPKLGLGEETIMSCKDLKSLEIYLPLIDKVKDKEEKRKLFLAYDNKFAELSNRPSNEK